MAGTANGVIFTKRCGDHDVVLFKGKTVNFSLTWGASEPVDVSDYGAEMIIKNAAGTTIASFTEANSRVIIGNTNGAISFYMSATDSAALTAGQYLYEINVTNDNNIKMLAMSGKCDVK